MYAVLPIFIMCSEVLLHNPCAYSKFWETDHFRELVDSVLAVESGTEAAFLNCVYNFGTVSSLMSE